MNLLSLRPLRYLTALLLLTGVAWAAPTGSSGSGTAIDVAQPTLALNWVIATAGVYPSAGNANTGTIDDAMLGEIRCLAFNGSMTGWLPCDGRLLSIAGNNALFSLLGTYYGGNGINTFALPDLRGRVPVGMENAAAIGQQGGQDQLTLTANHLPAHAHTVPGGLTSSTGNGAAFDKQQPYLKLNVCITAAAPFYSIGWVRVFGFSFNPSGFFPCTGGTAAISTYTSLYSRIGTTFGGNGTTTFGLPDLRGRSLLGSGPGIGLSPRSFGNYLGAATHTLSLNELPAHTHSIVTGNTGSTGNGVAFDKMQPSLTLNPVIAIAGIYLGSDEIPALGEVRFFAAINLPPNYSPCDGSLVSILDNNNLYSLIGTAYGGNGFSNFALPDLRGRCAAGLGNAGSGGGTRTIGNQWGAETLTLQLANLPAHTHDYTLAILAREPAGGGGTQIHFRYVDAPSQTYIVQSTDSLAPANWQPRATNTTDGLGQLDFVDAPPLPPARFYRTVQP